MQKLTNFHGYGNHDHPFPRAYQRIEIVSLLLTGKTIMGNSRNTNGDWILLDWYERASLAQEVLC